MDRSNERMSGSIKKEGKQMTDGTTVEKAIRGKGKQEGCSLWQCS